MLTFVIQSHRGVEQLVARRAHNPEAGGSSPPPATKNLDPASTEKSRLAGSFALWFHYLHSLRKVAK